MRGSCSGFSVGVLVYETFNPGAVTRVTAFKLDGTEVEVWKGKDPSAGKDIGTSKLPFKGDFPTNRIKLHIESTKVPGCRCPLGLATETRTSAVRVMLSSDG